LTFLYRFLY